jgi:hypothetical protein
MGLALFPIQGTQIFLPNALVFQLKKPVLSLEILLINHKKVISPASLPYQLQVFEET